MILAIDTTHEWGSLALLHDGQVLEEVTLHAPNGFAHLLFPELSLLLARNLVELRQIDCFAAANGPGSFTGVRVGLAAVKGLAEAAGRPAVGVSNLAAISSFGTRAVRAPVVDARRGEIFGAVYSAEGELLSPEVVMPLDAFLATIPADTELVSADEIAVPVTKAPQALAAAVARIAAKGAASGDPAALDANYIRRPDIRA